MSGGTGKNGGVDGPERRPGRFLPNNAGGTKDLKVTVKHQVKRRHLRRVFIGRRASVSDRNIPKLQSRRLKRIPTAQVD